MVGIIDFSCPKKLRNYCNPVKAGPGRKECLASITFGGE